MTTPNAQRGLTVEILRGRYESTANGITSRDRGLLELTIVGTIELRGNAVVPMPERSRVVTPNESRPAVAVATYLEGTAHLVPVEWSGHGYVRVARPMFGGNYAALNDSRLSEVLANYLDLPRYPGGALPVHDRIEH